MAMNVYDARELIAEVDPLLARGLDDDRAVAAATALQDARVGGVISGLMWGAILSVGGYYGYRWYRGKDLPSGG